VTCCCLGSNASSAARMVGRFQTGRLPSCPSGFTRLQYYFMVASQPIYNRYERRMVDTIWGTTNKPVSTKKLAERIESADALVGTLYVGYPILAKLLLPAHFHTMRFY
jgi:hypothetical protein